MEVVAPDPVSRVVIKDTPAFGRSAFAAENILAGEVVLVEDPIITYHPSSKDAVVEGVLALVKQQQKADPKHEAAKIHTEDWASSIGLYINFCRASEDVQALVLNEMQGEAQPGMEHTSPVMRMRIQAALLATLAPEITKLLEAEAAKGGNQATAATAVSSEPAVIQRVLLAADINVHSAGGGAAINHLGSKLAHTCSSPNTYYQSYRGRCCHVALRDIAAGELLTTSYMPSAMNIMSTGARQKFLREVFAFQCACERCSKQPDNFGALPCQHCATGEAKRSENGYLPMSLLVNCSSASSKPAATGLFRWDPTKAAPFDPEAEHTHSHEHHGCCGHDHDHDHHHHHEHTHGPPPGTDPLFKPWHCSKCGVELPDDDLELVGSFPYVQQAHVRLGTWAYNTAVHFHPQQDEDRLKELAMVLGPYHWSVHYALNAQTDVWKAMLRNVATMVQQQGGLQEDMTRALQNAAQGIEHNQRRTWAWLTKWCGLSTEQASELLYESLALNACSLLETSAIMAARLHGGSFRQMAANLKAVGLDLLEKAEPGLAKLRCWKTPTPHPLITQISMVQGLMAATKAAGSTGGGAAPAALDMKQLMDFLPAGPAAGKPGKPSGGSKGKAKKGGKKK